MGSTNLCTATEDSGAKVVIGWPQDVGATVDIWVDRFYEGLQMGYSIINAAVWADSYDYNAHFGSLHDNNVMRSRLIYGTNDSKNQVLLLK